MPKYEVKVSWSGYSRGESVYVLDAENEEEAKELYYEGERIIHKTVRDDTEHEIESIKENP